jgi:HSP20 family molecular chaperone IbpA
VLVRRHLCACARLQSCPAVGAGTGNVVEASGRERLVQLDVDGDVIRISSDYKKKEAVDDRPPQSEADLPLHIWHRSERAHEFLTRALRMPETADLSQLAASMDGGVLTINVPKFSSASKRVRIPIA